MVYFSSRLLFGFVWFFFFFFGNTAPICFLSNFVQNFNWVATIIVLFALNFLKDMRHYYSCLFLGGFILHLRSFYIFAHFTSLLILHVCSFYVCSFYMFAHFTSLLILHVCSYYMFAHFTCLPHITCLLILHVCSYYMFAHFTRLLILHVCSYYMFAHFTCLPHFTCLLILHVCSYYMFAHFTSLLILHVCSYYMFAHFTCLLILHVCSFYMFAHFTTSLPLLPFLKLCHSIGFLSFSLICSVARRRCDTVETIATSLSYGIIYEPIQKILSFSEYVEISVFRPIYCLKTHSLGTEFRLCVYCGFFFFFVFVFVFFSKFPPLNTWL